MKRKSTGSETSGGLVGVLMLCGDTLLSVRYVISQRWMDSFNGYMNGMMDGNSVRSPPHVDEGHADVPTEIMNYVCCPDPCFRR